MSAQPVIDYYLSPVSPWTYLASTRLRELAEKHNAIVDKFESKQLALESQANEKHNAIVDKLRKENRDVSRQLRVELDEFRAQTQERHNNEVQQNHMYVSELKSELDALQQSTRDANLKMRNTEILAGERIEALRDSISTEWRTDVSQRDLERQTTTATYATEVESLRQ